MIENVEAGGTISEPMRLSKNIPPLVTYMIAAGEKSGRLPQLLLSCADALEKAVQHLVKRLLIVLEPAITVVIAMVVAFIAIAIYIPFYQLLTLIPQ